MVFRYILILMLCFSTLIASSLTPVNLEDNEGIYLFLENESNVFYKGEQFDIIGFTESDAEKVRLFLRSELINETIVKNGVFRIPCVFNEVIKDEPLLFVAYSSDGHKIYEKSYRLSIFDSFIKTVRLSYSGDMKILSLPENIRYLRNEILEVTDELPEGTVLGMPKNPKIVFNKYRTGIGIKSTKYGFIKYVKVLSVPSKYKNLWPDKKIEEINSRIQYFSKSVSDGSIDASSDPIKRAKQIQKILDDYNTPDKKLYNKSYISSFKIRFPNNVEIKKSLSSNMKKLWFELQKAAKEWGYLQSLKEEDLNKSLTYRALKIALITAKKNGYEDRFCAEFASEFVRQAYKRAGLESFTGSPLVTNVNKELKEFGWIVWDPMKYFPPPGAVGMHTVGISPSHTYIIAGKPNGNLPGSDMGEFENGYYLWDSSKYTKGVNVHLQTQKQVNFMYDTGAFWLPPGVIPKER